MSDRLQGTMQMLKALRQSDGVTLDEITARTGIQKASLSRLENNAESNVTVNTLYRIADVLGYDLNVSVVRRSPPKPEPENAAKTDARKSRSRLATPGKVS